jgi:hypothetical protein
MDVYPLSIPGGAGIGNDSKPVYQMCAGFNQIIKDNVRNMNIFDGV